MKENKRFNAVKRRFYYELRQKKLNNSFFRSKSVLLVEDSREAELDLFFSKYKEDLRLFKSHLDSLEQIY
ncbi:Uncharacterised protein [uncultured archaeon]|nr:Uncharacterised protein [uncultured archaeon]